MGAQWAMVATTNQATALSQHNILVQSIVVHTESLDCKSASGNNLIGVHWSEEEFGQGPLN